MMSVMDFLTTAGWWLVPAVLFGFACMWCSLTCGAVTQDGTRCRRSDKNSRFILRRCHQHSGITGQDVFAVLWLMLAVVWVLVWQRHFNGAPIINS